MRDDRVYLVHILECIEWMLLLSRHARRLRACVPPGSGGAWVRHIGHPDLPLAEFLDSRHVVPATRQAEACGNDNAIPRLI
jgi:hypothetical protein